MSDPYTHLRKLLAETATVEVQDFPGAGSERSFSAYVCSHCGEGVHVGDVIASGPENIRHWHRCPLNPKRVVTLFATELSALLDEMDALKENLTKKQVEDEAERWPRSMYSFDALNSLPVLK